jgi:hypothetical protein
MTIQRYYCPLESGIHSFINIVTVISQNCNYFYYHSATVCK